MDESRPPHDLMRVEADASIVSLSAGAHYVSPFQVADPKWLDAFPLSAREAARRWWRASAHGLAANSRHALNHDIGSWCAWASNREHAALVWPIRRVDLERWVIAANTTKGRFHRSAGDKTPMVSMATMRRRLWALRTLHRAIELEQGTAALPDPTQDYRTLATLRALARWSAGREGPNAEAMETHAPPPRRRQRPPLTNDAEEAIGVYVGHTLKALAAAAPTSSRAAARHRRLLRDWALLLVARDTMARRDELSRFTWADRRGVDGPLVIQSSKTDQSGVGNVRPLTEHSAAALEAWRVASEAPDDAGALPIFRMVTLKNTMQTSRLTGQGIDRAIRNLAAAAGVSPPAFTEREFGAHSTRIGMAIDLAIGGASTHQIMVEGRWKSRATLDGYLEQAGAVESAVKIMRQKRHASRP
jgi:integrase